MEKVAKMGYLTTITFYNDAAYELREHPEEVSKGIYEAQLGEQRSQGYNYFPVGCHANPVIIQKPRHADDHTLYLHAGNTVIEAYDVDSDWGIDAFIKEMEFHLKRLKKLKKERGKK